MNKFLGVFATFAAIVVVVGIWFFSTYNSFVSADERVNQTYAQIQNVMQRQAELIPNLVTVAKESGRFEQSTLTAVTEARAKAAGVINIDPAKIAADPALQKQFMEAQQSLAGSLGRLLLVNERYPELKTVALYAQLMTELTGSINRVAVERRRNQQAVEEYNRLRRGFFSSMIAARYDFKERPYFAADPASQRQPTVSFN